MLPHESTRPGKRLAGKVALVTGAGSVGEGFGTGKAIAIVFAREGARLVLADHDRARAGETQEQIASIGGEAHVVTGDITSSADCARMVREGVERFSALHCLVNNIGISARGTVVELEEPDWDKVIAVNLKGMYLAAKHAVPAIIAAGGGSILNISSIGARLPNIKTPLTAYTASKGGVEALTKAMAVDHGPQGIRVNCIAPGPLFTPRQIARGLDEERRAKRRALSLVDREGTGWDVAWAAAYLASDEARYITGVVLPVDGGVAIRGHEYR